MHLIRMPADGARRRTRPVRAEAWLLVRPKTKPAALQVRSSPASEAFATLVVTKQRK